MYSCIHLNFGKTYWENEYKAEFKIEKVVDLSEIELCNDRVQESDMGRVWYPAWYDHDNGPYGSYMTVVKDGDEETGKENLKKAVLETLEKRIKQETTIANLVKEVK